MGTLEDISVRARTLSEKQQNEVLEFMNYLEFRDRAQSARTMEPTPLKAELVVPPVTTPSYGYGAPFKRDSGIGPWCETCGSTMGMRGGEYICTSCHSYP